MKSMSHPAQVLERSAALAISVALHLAVLLAVSWSAAVHSSDKNADHDVEVRLINDAGQIKPKAETLDEGRRDVPVDGEPSNAGCQCDGRIYTGIGLRAWSSGVILEVASGSPQTRRPARRRHLHGLRRAERTSKPGTPITLRYLREERGYRLWSR